MNILRLMTILLVVEATACGTTVQFASTNPSPRALAPRAPHTVAVFTSGPPSQPFVEVGVLQARQESELSRDEFPQIVAEMREEAAAIGCDGLIITGRADELTGSLSAGPTLGSDIEMLEGLMGTCIVFVEPNSAEHSTAQAPAAQL